MPPLRAEYFSAFSPLFLTALVSFLFFIGVRTWYLVRVLNPMGSSLHRQRPSSLRSEWHGVPVQMRSESIELALPSPITLLNHPLSSGAASSSYMRRSRP